MILEALNPSTGEPFEPTDQQLPFLEAEEPRAMMSGAVGAGKTLAECVSLFLDAWTAPGLYFLGAPTYPMLHLSTWLTWEEVVPRAAVKRALHRETELVNGARIVGLTLSHAGRLKGPNMSGGAIDEIVEAPWESIEQLTMRLRQGGDRYVQRLRAATNPLWGCEVWKRLIARPDELAALGIEEQEIERILDARGIWHISNATTAGNPHLGEQYLANLRRSLTLQDQRIWLDGEWLPAQGNVYAFDLGRHVVEPPPDWIGGLPPERADYVLLLGFDFGSSVENKFAIEAVAVKLGKKPIFYIWREYWKPDPDLTPASRWAKETLATRPRNRWVLFSEHQPSIRRELQKPIHVGRPLELAKKDTERNRIDVVNRLLLNDQLFVIGVRGGAGGLMPIAPGLVSEWSSLTWEQLGKPNPPNDAADALEYAVYTLYDREKVGWSRDPRFRR